MKKLSYSTVGLILSQLSDAGLTIPRATFYNLEEHKVFPTFGKRTAGNWRIFTDEEMQIIKRAIWKNYKGTNYPGI
jgi:hypothetical protein